MTPGWRRYAEPRLYLTALSLGLLAIVWSALYAQDHGKSEEASVEATDDLRSATRDSAAVPHTRTRGS